MTHLCAIIAIVLYIVSSGIMMVQLWRSKVGGQISSWARGVFIAGLISHSVTMGLVVQDPQVSLLDNGADYFLWVSWALGVVFALFQRRLNYPIVGAFVVPAIVLFMGCSTYLLHKVAGPGAFNGALGADSASSTPVLLHAIPAMVSVVSLTLSLVVSVVFLIVERRLKQRKIAALSISGPSLQLLDRFNKQLALVGFAAISLVILSGGFLAVSQQKPMFSADTSVVSGILVWVLIAFILYSRSVLHRSARQVSRLTLVVTTFFFATLFVVLATTGRLTHAEFWL